MADNNDADNEDFTLTSDMFESYQKYKMNHKHRGIAILFVHEKFEDKSMTPRDDALRYDGITTLKCLEEIGFEVRLFLDQKISDIIKILRGVSLEDHSEYDCLAVFVSTHGLSNGRLSAKDGMYHEKELWKPFSAKKCRTLQGKPKLFFIQACRGAAIDDGIELLEEEELNKFESSVGQRSHLEAQIPSRVFLQPTEPESDLDGPVLSWFSGLFKKKSDDKDIEKDCLVVHATIPGYVAWRSSGRSWFLEKLCEELSLKPKTHLLVILSVVSGKVGTLEKAKKQMMCVRSKLSKLLFFY